MTILASKWTYTKQHWRLILVTAIIVSIGFLLVKRWREFGFDWSEFTIAFSRLDWKWVAAGVVFALLTYLGRALRWQILLRPLKQDSNLWNLVSSTAIGFTAIILFGRAGELVRPYLIAIKEDVPFPSQIAAWLIERLCDVLMVLLIAGFALSRIKSSGVYLGPKLQAILQTGGYVVTIMGFTSVALLFVFSQFTSKMRQRLLEALSFLPEAKFRRVERIVTAFTQGIESTRSGRFVFQLAFYSILEWALIVACYACVFQAMPLTAVFSIADILIFLGIVAFGSIIQIPGVGGGGQVAAIIILTELFGLSLEASSSMAILLWATTLLVIMPIGLMLALHDGINWRKLRKLEQEAAL